MAVPMASLKRDRKTGDWVARKGIPADVRVEYQRLYGQRWETLFRAKAGTPQSEARRQFTDRLADTEGRIAVLRAAGQGEGRALTRREAHALAGEWYKWFVGRFEDQPGDEQGWSVALAVLKTPNSGLRQRGSSLARRATTSGTHSSRSIFAMTRVAL